MSRTNNSRGCRSRIVQFSATRLVLALLIVVLFLFVAQALRSWLPFESQTDWAGRILLTNPLTSPLDSNLVLQALVSGIITILFCYAGFRTYTHFIERRELSELAPAGALKELGSGVIVGVLLVSIMIGVLAVLGYYKMQTIHHASILVISLAGAAISAFVEEVLFRGIVFRLVEESLGTWLSLLFSAALFGMLHLGNPEATLIGSLVIVLEAGVLLAAAYILTRRLWLAIGVHFAWNFTLAGVFGASSSQGLLDAEFSGPVWLSGGEYGPEGSLIAVVLCLILAVFFLVRGVRQGQIRTPSWRRTP